MVIPSGREESFPLAFSLSVGERQIMIHFVVSLLLFALARLRRAVAFAVKSLVAVVLSDDECKAVPFGVGDRQSPAANSQLGGKLRRLVM